MTIIATNYDGKPQVVTQVTKVWFDEKTKALWCDGAQGRFPLSVVKMEVLP